MTRIIVDSSLCRDCQACTLACSLVHEGECNPGLARLRVRKDMARYEFEITLCQQCDEPECLAACAFGAIRYDRMGALVLAEDGCTRCGACARACPHHAIFPDPSGARYLMCDLCAGRAAGPLCVEMCPVGALAIECETPRAMSMAQARM